MKNLEKQLKKYSKGKYKINLNLLVTFLITGQIGYSLEIYEDWVNNGTLNETVNIKLPEITIVNNGVISENSDNSNYAGNGIFSYSFSHNNSNSLINNIHNHGIIMGSSYAIASIKENSLGDITNIINNGILVGKNIFYGNVSGYMKNGVEILLNDTGEIKK